MKCFTANDKYGGMPPQIFGLNKLRSLAMTGQAIRFVPREIGWLTRLSKLLLNDNPYLEEVSGDIGQCDLSGIFRLRGFFDFLSYSCCAFY